MSKLTSASTAHLAVDVKPRKWRSREWISLACGLALLALAPVTALLEGAFPVLTVLWLCVPLVSLLAGRDAAKIGIRSIAPGEFVRVAAVALGLEALLAAAVEPWSHAYGALVKVATTGTSLDTTFAWLVRYEGPAAWAGFLLYSGLVTIFAEELFFRGWLLQLLKTRIGAPWAVAVQAVLFTLPQGIAAFVLSPVQGIIYAVIYSWLAIGVVGGWAAARTGSIWPSLASAVILNFVLSFALL